MVMILPWWVICNHTNDVKQITPASSQLSYADSAGLIKVYIYFSHWNNLTSIDYLQTVKVYHFCTNSCPDEGFLKPSKVLQRVNQKHQEMPFKLPGAALQDVSYIAQSVYFPPTGPGSLRKADRGELVALLTQGLLPAWAAVPAGMSWHCGCCKQRASVLSRDSVPSPLLGSVWC